MLLENRRWISIVTACENGDNIIITPMDFNAIIMYSKTEKKAKIIKRFPNENIDEWRLYGSSCIVNNKVIFIPDRSKSIGMYDIETKDVSMINVNEPSRISAANCVKADGKVYFVSHAGTGKVCCFDVEKNKVDKYEFPVNISNIKTTVDLIHVNNSLWFASKERDMIVEFNMQNKSFKIYRVNADGVGFGTISYYNNMFWLSTENNLFKWDFRKIVKIEKSFPNGFGLIELDNNEIITTIPFKDKGKRNEKPFNFSIVNADKLYLLPFRSNMLVEYDFGTEMFSNLNEKKEEETVDSLKRARRITHCHYILGENNSDKLFFSTVSKQLYLMGDNSDYSDKKEFSICLDADSVIDENMIQIEGLDGMLEEFICRML